MREAARRMNGADGDGERSGMTPVLLIAYHYPPAPAVGGVRPHAFARYLPGYGWSPIVLTVPTEDKEGRAGLAAGSVHQVAEWPHPLKVYERWRSRQAERRGTGPSRAAQIEVPYEQCFTPARGLPARTKRSLLALLSLPDREAAWVPPAVRAGLRLIRRHEIRHVITTGPPFTAHVVGLALKRLAPVAWIADFRDPWSLRHKFPIFRSPLSDRLETRLIARVMRDADLILSVTPAMTDEARKEHPLIPVERFHTLTSGFDPEELASIDWSRPDPTPLVFSYFGTFYHGRTPEPFLAALSGLIQDGSLKPEDVRVRFVGQVGRADGQSVQGMVARLGLAELVSLHGSVSRHEALKQTLESHVVLVLDERHPLQVPLKLYDALGAGPVIFNIGSRGAVADILTRTGRGVAVHYQNRSEIRKGLLACIRRARAALGQNRPAPWQEPAVQDFDFRRLTQRLSMYLEALSAT
ncbi:hypothetical protein [Candidatus Nitrospira bockiana]